MSDLLNIWCTCRRYWRGQHERPSCVVHGELTCAVPTVINRVGAKPLRHQDLVSTFSGGVARRLEIARGMPHTPTTTRNLRHVSNQDL